METVTRRARAVRKPVAKSAARKAASRKRTADEKLAEFSPEIQKRVRTLWAAFRKE